MDQNNNITNGLNASLDAKRMIRALRATVKFNLSLRGLTLADLAKVNGIRGTSICLVFYHPYPRMEKVIADALGLQPWDLWPERYDKNGKPNRRNAWYERKSGAWKPKIDVVTT